MADAQFGELLWGKRFSGLFFKQFFGALNDNLFKNALIMLVAFQAGNSAGDTTLLVNLCAGLFILPFFVASGFAGQLADRLDKSKLIRQLALLELMLMIAAAVALQFSATWPLITILCLMGLQSALFGPVKYGIVPELLNHRELLRGNALIEAGTFLAILLGTIAGGLLIAHEHLGRAQVGAAVIAVALIGYLFARRIPSTGRSNAELKADFAPVATTVDCLKIAYRNRTLWLSILGISWFWLCGALVLAQLPGFTKEVLQGDESTVTVLLAVFSIGIGLGSFICERLAGHRVEIGLVPIGAFGISAAAIDIYFASGSLDTALLVAGLPLRVLFDLALLGAFGGVFIVPLYALIQARSEADERSRVIAANNIVNALFMVVAAIAAIGMHSLGFSIPEMLLTMGLINLAVSAYIFSVVPEFTLRFVAWVLVHTIYRLRTRNTEALPESGAVLVVANHVSFVDALVLSAAFDRPMRFVIDHRIYRTFGLNYLFRAVRAIPIAPRHEDADGLRKAMDQVADALAEGEAVCIFPEGKLTKNGEMNPFKPGVERIIERSPVPVLPVALRGLWGSLFSREQRDVHRRRPNKLLAIIEVHAGAPIEPQAVTASGLEQEVRGLRADAR